MHVPTDTLARDVFRTAAITIDETVHARIVWLTKTNVGVEEMIR